MSQPPQPPHTPEVPSGAVPSDGIPSGAAPTDGVPSGATPADAVPAAQPPLPKWVRPNTVIEWRETPPLEFHQLLRGTAKYRWWRPLMAIIIGIFYYLTLSVVFTVVVMSVYFVIIDGELSAESMLELALPDTQKPVSILLTFGSVALMLPAVLLAMLSVGLTPTGRIWSVALRIRWRWIGRTIIPAIVSLLVGIVLSIGLSILFEGVSGGDQTLDEAAPVIDPTLAMWSLLLALFLVPLQATAEEMVFRGMFMQALGGWLGGVRGSSAVSRFLRGAWLPILIPAVLFGFSHIYDVWGWGEVVALAIVAGWLTWRTGGLEAAISLHVLNNLIVTGVLASGFGGATGQTTSTGGPAALLGSLVGLLLYLWWVDRDFARRDGVRTRIDLVPERAS